MLIAAGTPGVAEERFLVVELEAEAAGETATVSAYPVERGGRTELAAARAGRQRLAVRLAPTVAAPGTAIVDVEQDGEELWSDELRVEKRAEPRVQSTVVAGPEPHDLRVHVESQRVIAEFRCASPTLVVGTTAAGNRFLSPLGWRGPGQWYAENARRAEDLPEAARTAAARLLGQSTIGEARFGPWRGRIALVLPDLEPARAQLIVQEITELVALLPPPSGEPPLPTTESGGRFSPTRAEVLRAHLRVLEPARAALFVGDLDRELPVRHDPIHGPWLDGATLPRALVVEAQLTASAHTLSLSCDPSTSSDGRELHVPAGHGTWRGQLPIEMELWREGFVEIALALPSGGIVASTRVPAGRSGAVLLDELAARLPGATRRSDQSVVVRSELVPDVVLRLSLDFGDGPPAERDPLRSFGKRLFGKRLASLAGDVDGRPGGSIRELRASLDLPFDSGTSLGGARDFRVVDEGGELALVADVTGADVSRVEECARSMLTAVGRLRSRG